MMEHAPTMLSTYRGCPFTPAVQWAFTDLDGTLLQPDQTISQPVREAVALLVEKIPVSIATGRERLETIQFAAELQLTASQICDGGGAIFSMPSGQVEWSLPLGAVAVKAILEELSAEGSFFFATHPGGAYTNLKGDVLKLPWVTNDPCGLNEGELTRISALNLSARKARILASRLGRLGLHTARAYLPYNGLWAVDCTHRDADKGVAAARIAAAAQVDLKCCVAIGDSYNDLPMLSACGLAISMDGAPPEVLKMADHIVPPVEDDGLAIAITEIILPLINTPASA